MPPALPALPVSKVLPRILIALALGLCALVAYQWNRENLLHNDRQSLQDKVAEHNQTIRVLRATLKTDETEVARLETVRTELSLIVKSNRVEIEGLQKNLRRTEQERDSFRDQFNAYKEAVDKQNESLRRQNEIITEQNGRIKSLANERNGIIERFNKLAKDYNLVVKAYGELAERLAAAEAPAAPPENHPAPSTEQPIEK